MDAFADVVSTKKVRRFTLPPAALPDDAAALRRAAAARTMRIFAVVAVLALMTVSLLIALS